MSFFFPTDKETKFVFLNNILNPFLRLYLSPYPYPPPNGFFFLPTYDTSSNSMFHNGRITLATATFVANRSHLAAIFSPFFLRRTLRPIWI